MDWNIKIYRDRDFIGAMPKATKSVLHKEKLFTYGQQNTSFCGLIFHNQNIDVFLPRNSNYNEEDYSKIQIASLVLNTIRLYSIEFDSPLSIDDGEIDNQIGGLSLSLIAELINDYRQNGIYAKRQSLNTLNSGKPNWSKTIARSVLYPSGSNSIYLDVFGNKRVNLSSCEVAKIHASVIKELDKRFSLLLYGSDGIFSEDHIKEPISSDIQYQIYTLEKELRVTYSGRDIWLLKSLIDYLKKMKGDHFSEMVIGIKHFHTVWEYMLSKTLSNTVNVNKLIPIPTYKLTNESLVSAARKGQRMDTVLWSAKENTYCIVDAKYYSASSISNAPGWPDLVKQFFYAKALKQIEPDARVLNAFVFPNSTGMFSSAHMQDRQDGHLLNNDYEPIKCAYIEPVEVLRSFVDNKKLKCFSESLLTEPPQSL
ncbi:LlaJI family restriction endonuclease [Psychrobium sp. nBUS_13]|uniref:LlaJI family restriction endonuclease n=1 Tax=Psychrobium sp. nBUS_13 TaxID=3395319 RepID=UPI003EB8218A